MNAVAADSLEQIRAQLFDDVLVCEEIRPAAFLPASVDAAQSRAQSLQAEALLRALSIVEDSGRHEEADPHVDAAFRRLEAKVDLLTALIAGFANGQSMDATRPLRWSARGARLVSDTAPPLLTQGLFRVRPAEWLPSPLVLPATVVAIEPDPRSGLQALWLRFDGLGSGLEAALERQLFRVHRRAVAESRRLG